MLAKDKLLKVLLYVLAVLVIISAVVACKGSHRPRVVYVNNGPAYDPQVLQLGAQASRFGGMSIYRDSPGALLSRAEKLALTPEQQQRLQAIVQKSRRQAVAVLTEEQLADISPIPEEPVVLAKLTPTFPTCTSCSSSVCDAEKHAHAH